MGMRPGWVAGLVAESFFVACPAHEAHKKNERNIFCLACCASICPHCAAAHRHHPLLQVRRYVYHDVVRLGDLEKLIDCSYVQTYTINSAKVIFLKPRPQSRPFKGSGNVCLTCDRILQEPFHFCSLSCKVDHVMMQGGDLSNIMQYYGGVSGGGATADPNHLAFPRFENLRVDGSDLDDDTDGGQVTPNSILEDPMQHYSNAGGGGSSDNGGDARVGSAARRGEVAKRKKGGGFFPQIVLSLGNRRKGAPTMSTHERKASIREFYAVIFPSLMQLHEGINEVEDKKQKAICIERYKKRDEDPKMVISEIDDNIEEECGICMETNTKVVLPTCSHAMCIKCYRDWRSRSQSCPFCRDSLKRVNSADLWIYTDNRDIVDMATVRRENLRRLFMYIDKLPTVIPESVLDIYDSHVK